MHTPAPDFFELKPVLSTPLPVDGGGRPERSPPPTLWRKDTHDTAAVYYKNKPFHQESCAYILCHWLSFPGPSLGITHDTVIC